MLDNEPNARPTQDSDVSGTPPAFDAAAAGTDQSTARPARKRAASRRTTKKTAADTPPAAAVAAPAAEPTTGDRPAKKTAKKAAAKRTTKKATTAAQPDQADTPQPTTDATASDGTRRSSGRAGGRRRSRGSDSATPPDSAPPSDGSSGSAAEPGGTTEVTPAGTETKKTTRKRTTKKTAKKLAAVDPAAVDAAAAPVDSTKDDAAADGGTEAERHARAVAAAAVLFQAPVEFDEPPRRRTRKKAAAESEPVAEPAAEAEVTDAETDDSEVESADGDGEGGRRRRRRRGGRRRRKAGEDDAADGDESDDETETAAADETPDEEAEATTDAADEDGDGSGTSRRRRRRRRRKGEEGTTVSPDDPDETVVRVREPRAKGKESEITAVEGSTRLEAKKQRRREGRAAGRRRAPIVSEAEFLARRESVERTMVIRARDDLMQIAVSEDNVLVEHYVAQAEQTSLIGNVYLGRVQNVLPSMEAAFIDIGKGRNAVLYAGEVDWATLGATNGQRKIESVLKSGQSVLVQVTKDPVGHKGARLTNQISLPGRYVVYVPRGGNGGISRKLPDTERNRLKGILKDIVPDEAGVIVRTAAEGASEEELTRDVSRLKSYWDDIDKKSGNGQAPQLLYGEPDLLIRVVRDLFTEDFTKLVISGDEAFDLVNEYVSYVAPHLADRVEKWSGDGDVFANFRIDEQIRKALDRKVWLPSGGSLIIDRTEAMTVVDVNTGKFTGSGGNLEETVTRNNLEAAEEIVRQLRLRDIGGIIVVDFIDMVLESNRELVLRRLVECLGRDRTKHQVAEVTSLGLVQMTRKRIGTGLLEAFTETCDHCGGRGLILHDEPREPKRRSEGGRQTEEPAKGKSSRGGRKSRKAKQEPVEEQPSDAAQRLAEIAAATVTKESEPELAVAPV